MGYRLGDPGGENSAGFRERSGDDRSIGIDGSDCGVFGGGAGDSGGVVGSGMGRGDDMLRSVYTALLYLEGGSRHNLLL